MTRTPKDIDEAIALTRHGEYLQALTKFVDIYGTSEAPPIKSPKDASGLSFFGLALGLVRRDHKMAVDLCKRAIDLEFYNGDHYANLARVYINGNNRKKAVETADAGLKVAPENEYLLEVRKELGVRSRPPLPILDRAHPINVTLGQARHAKRSSSGSDKTAKKKR